LERFQTAKVTFKVSSTGAILWATYNILTIPVSLPLQLCPYLVPFPRYHRLFPKQSRYRVTLNSRPSWVIYHSTLVLISINLHTKFEMSSFTHSKDMTGASIVKNGSCDTDHAPFKDALSSVG